MKTYEKYKDSGIEWIGDIPEHWKVKKFKYWLNSTSGGGTPSTSNVDFWNGNIPWVSPKDMKTDFITKTEDYITDIAVKESSTNLIPPNRVITVVRSGILKHTLPVAINKVEVSLNQDMKAFEPNSDVLPIFLFWKLKGQSSDILAICNKIGATVDSLEMQYLFNLPFAVPPIPEQTAIADYLDEKTAEIDKLIANKKRLIELLKEERTAIINKAVTKGINADAKLKPSGIDWLGDIPENWEVKKFKYWLNSTSGGGTPSTSNKEYWNGNIPWVSPKDMKTHFISKTEDYITEIAVKESSTNLIPANRVLIVVRSGILKHTL